jgi:hypothetical protein
MCVYSDLQISRDPETELAQMRILAHESNNDIVTQS